MATCFNYIFISHTHFLEIIETFKSIYLHICELLSLCVYETDNACFHIELMYIIMLISSKTDKLSFSLTLSFETEFHIFQTSLELTK